MTTALITIDNTTIKQDDEGRYCLNDLHKAAGNQVNHQPNFFMKRKETADLIAAIQKSDDSLSFPVEIRMGRNGGTYVCEDLVFAYAMWISPEFHLKGIRAYRRMVSQPVTPQFAIPTTLHEALRPFRNPQPVYAPVNRSSLFHALFHDYHTVMGDTSPGELKVRSVKTEQPVPLTQIL